MDSILKNPGLLKAAMQDPKMADALQKLGYAKYQEEKTGEDLDADEVDWSSADGRMAKLEARYEMDQEFSELREELGRKLEGKERAEILDLVAQSGGYLRVKQAWMLSQSYQSSLAAKHQKEVDAARGGKRNVPRPSPVPGIHGGQKIDTKKPIKDMNPTEYRESLREDIEKMME